MTVTQKEKRSIEQDNAHECGDARRLEGGVTKCRERSIERRKKDCWTFRFVGCWMSFFVARNGASKGIYACVGWAVR